MGLEPSFGACKKCPAICGAQDCCQESTDETPVCAIPASRMIALGRKVKNRAEVAGSVLAKRAPMRFGKHPFVTQEARAVSS